MAKIQNIFTNSRMDSDTNYGMVDNKSYVLAKNLRITGKGDDGIFKFLKGSKLLTEEYASGNARILGAKEGKDNKIYYLLGSSNFLSRVVEYDILTENSKVIIEDSEYLRFDLVRWNNGVEIMPYKFILSIDQIDNLLFISNEAWEYPRVINITRDYSLGFNEEDIVLAKKPPKDAPLIIEWQDNNVKTIDKNTFVSFASRYKYADGEYSALTYYSETAFEPENILSINSQKEHLGMVNKYDTVKLEVKSGGKYVTDIEVYAREHNSPTAYLIYSVNKKIAGIADDVNISNIVYKYSKNYEVLSSEVVNMLYSNVPKYPKAQTVAGNRIIYGNYKEGLELLNSDGSPFQIDFKATKTQTTFGNTWRRKSAVSLFNDKVAAIFLNDYNESTTALMPTNQPASEVEITFADRLKANHLQVEMFSAIPQNVTKLKFVVKSASLDYEELYITYAKKLGGFIYFLLNADNTNRLNKGDTIYRTDISANNYIEYFVEEVSYKNITDGFSTYGLYAKITDDGSINLISNGSNVTKTYNYSTTGSSEWWWLDSITDSTNPNRFDGTSGYNGSYVPGGNTARLNYGFLYKSDFGAIYEGDVLNIVLTLNYKGGSKEGKVDLNINLFAAKNYNTITDFVLDTIDNPYIKVVDGGNTLFFYTNHLFPDLVRVQAPEIYSFKPTIVYFLLVKPNTNVRLERGVKPLIIRTKNKNNLEEFFYETEKTYPIVNGVVIPDKWNGNNPIFDIGYYNGYCWENGLESYKIKDAFNQKYLNYKFRATLFEKNGYKQIHRKYSLTYSGIYNSEFNINNLATFNASLANWKDMPINYGQIQRIISTDGDITVFCVDKVINQYYGKSIIMDAQGIENVGLTNEVLGSYKELGYEFGVGEHPESVSKFSNIVFFVDNKRMRFLMKQGEQIQELNQLGSGFYQEGIDVLKKGHTFLGSYDESNNEYVVSVDLEQSIGFNFTNKGFTSYYTYKHDYLLGGYGNYYSAYKGKIFQNEITENYNTFAGQENQKAQLTFVVNPEFDEDKIFKAMYLQSNKAWDVEFKSNLNYSKVPKELLVKKESFFHTNIYRSEEEFHSATGIGEVKSILNDEIIFSQNIPNSISVGDALNKENGTSVIITSINNNVIKTDSLVNINIGDYVFSTKKSENGIRPDSDPIRGKWMEVQLSLTDDTYTYIGGATSEVDLSPL